MNFRPLVEVRVFFDRMGLILAAIPHLWVHYGDWDEAYCIETLVWRLKRLERVLTKDPNTDPVRTESLREFLRLIAERDRGTERVPRSPLVEAWLGRTFSKHDDGTSINDDREEFSDWAQAVHDYDEKVWADAWNLFRDQARIWWT